MTLYHLYLSIPKFLSGAAGNDTGNNIEKRPDSMKLFEHKNTVFSYIVTIFALAARRGLFGGRAFFDDSANIV